MEDRIINAIVRHGGHTQDGKRRIYMYYRKNEPSMTEFGKFLKEEYGIGGSHPAHREGDRNWSWDTCGYADGKKTRGLYIEEYTLFPYEKGEGLDLPWTEVAERTASLIDDGSFMDAKDYSTGQSRWNLRKLIWVR